MNCEECEKKQKRIEELERMNKGMAESFDRIVYGIETEASPDADPKVFKMPHTSCKN